MATQLRPEARLSLLTKIDSILYTKSNRRLRATLDTLIRDNSIECLNMQNAMSYQGEIYHNGPIKKTEGPMNLLHPVLRSRMREYLVTANKLSSDRSMALGYIRQIMTQTNYAADLYKLLPEHLHQALSGLDRFFLPGDGEMTSEEITVFMEKHKKYIRLVKARLTYNLLDVGTV